MFCACVDRFLLCPLIIMNFNAWNVIFAFMYGIGELYGCFATNIDRNTCTS